VKQISGDLLYGRLMALPANTILDWEGQPVRNTLAYWALLGPVL
jgi:hypothetical protein